MSAPEFLENDKAFIFLRNNDVESFNREVLGRGGEVVLKNANLRGVDFREFDVSSLYLISCYLKDADLRGCDIRHWDMEGASIHKAHLGGTYFSDEVLAEEINMSLVHGTRIRTMVNHRVVVGAVKKKKGPKPKDDQPVYDK